MSTPTIGSGISALSARCKPLIIRAATSYQRLKGRAGKSLTYLLPIISCANFYAMRKFFAFEHGLVTKKKTTKNVSIDDQGLGGPGGRDADSFSPLCSFLWGLFRLTGIQLRKEGIKALKKDFDFQVLLFLKKRKTVAACV